MIKRPPWLNRTVLGIGLASLLSDCSHEIATTVMPAFLATMGVSAAWLGLIEGTADGLSSFAKMASGYWTDRLPRRKPVAVVGYLVTALGTASFGLASQAWHLLVARSVAWFGRGARTPIRKALLAAAGSRETYGRAFGFERMMDTLGAIIGPATAFVLLGVYHLGYPALFALTLIPGLAAAALIAFAVVEKERPPVAHISFGESLRVLPPRFRRFVAAVGIFGLGDFSHTLLIWLCASQLTPTYGAAHAAAAAAGFYLLHNVVNAAAAPVAGWLSDRSDRSRVLMLGYGLAALMALCILVLPPTLGSFTVIFVLAGIHASVVETAEDSLAADLVPREHHGVAFGTVATVNGIGDFASSVVVGLLWTRFGPAAGAIYCLVLFAVGAAFLATLSTQPPREAP